MNMHEALYYITRKNETVRCDLCPHYCVLEPKEIGKCGVRINHKGKLYTKNYAVISGLHSDPIEKKPLYHFFPGKKILSVGSIGCNLHCRFCQNYSISQAEFFNTKQVSRSNSDFIISKALNTPENIGIAYTYNEPFVSYEFVAETAEKAQVRNLKNIIVSNGFINLGPLRRLMPLIDAYNIDLKAFSEGFYKTQTGGSLAPVLNSIKEIAKAGKHLEISMLVIPGLNDGIEEFRELLKFIKNEIGENTVLHLSRYFPAYLSQQAITPEKTLKTLFEEAKKMINFVYLGNISTNDGQNTYCPKCKTKLITRSAYNTEIINLDNNGRCTKCNYKLFNSNAYEY